MLHKLLLVLISLLPVIHTDNNLIDWSPDRKLTWADFKGTPNPSSPNAALTNSSINVEFGFNGKGMTHSIKCRFNKSLSWGRIKNDYILKHEQGHFDIAEIHARLLHKALLDYAFNAKTVNDDVTKIYNSVIDAHVKFQKSYDLETNHSIDTAQQVVWNRKIDSLLGALKSFSDYK
jgi:hypothetical protein